MSFVGPYPVALAMQRLVAEATSLKHVGVADDLRSAIETKPNASPAAYVVKQERSNPPIGGSNGVLAQMCRVSLSIVLMVQNHGGAEKKRAQMDALIGEVRAALLKWTPDLLRFQQLAHEMSRDELQHGAWLVCQEVFATQYPIEVRP